MPLVGSLGLQFIDTLGWRPELVGGPTAGANPIAIAMMMTAVQKGRPLGAFIVLKDANPETGSCIEGPYRSGARVVVVEDTVTSGKSLLKAIETLVTADAVVLGVLALIDREQGGMEAITRAGYNFASIFTLSELLAT
ncbi:MAG: phosphoribosyltransferase family protein [Patescibacteria group bacterium]